MWSEQISWTQTQNFILVKWKIRISWFQEIQERDFFVALPRKLQVNGFSISVLLFIIFLTCLHVNFSPQPRWQPAVGSCMWHRVADYQRCIAALTRGRPLLACCRPHSSPDWTHTPHILPLTQEGLRDHREREHLQSNRWQVIKIKCDGKTQPIWRLLYINFTQYYF